MGNVKREQDQPRLSPVKFEVGAKSPVNLKSASGPSLSCSRNIVFKF